MLVFLLSIVEEDQANKIEYIYNKYHVDMLRFAQSRLKRLGIKDYQTLSEDAVQNSFLKIVKYVDKIDLSVSQKELKAYIFSIVANETINIRSDYEQEFSIDDISECDDSFIQKLEVKEYYDKVVKYISEMDEKYSITMFYHYFKELSVDEISEIMGISKKTVYTRLLRGKNLLRKFLEQDNG